MYVIVNILTFKRILQFVILKYCNIFSVFSIRWSCRVYTRLFLLYTRLPSGASRNRLIWLAVASRNRKPHGVETGAASIIQTTNFVAKRQIHRC